MTKSYEMFVDNTHIDAWIYVTLASIKIPSVLFLEADDTSYSLDKRRKSHEYLSDLYINLSDANNLDIFKRGLDHLQTKKVLCNRFCLESTRLYEEPYEYGSSEENLVDPFA